MPYNPYGNYSPYNSYYPYNNNVMPQSQTPINNQQPQLQNGGVVIVQSMKEAQDYLVANGTSVTFLDMNARKVYIKTKGFATFDPVVFESYKLIKDDDTAPEEAAPDYVSKKEFDSIKAEVEKLKSELGKFAEREQNE